MGIGDVFSKAFELWRRDVGWLILAGLVVGLIMVVILGVAVAIFGAIFAGAGLTIGANMAANDSGALNAVGAGMIVLGIIVYILTVFLVQVVGMVFYGGMFEMVIGAARGGRGVEFGDLFGGFHKFGAYALFALVMFGVSIGTSVLNVIPVIGAIISLVVGIWIGVIWLYVLPLIADQGVGFAAAAKRSFEMVKSVGWWRTFGMVLLLGVMTGLGALVIVLIAVLVGQGSDWAGILLGFVLFLLFAVFVPPYVICYVSTMYLGSGGAAEPVAVGAVPGAPLPPAPGTTYGTPASPTVAAPPAGEATAITAAGAPVPPPPADADAWRAAADPLAARPPASPSVGVETPASDTSDAETAVGADAGPDSSPASQPDDAPPAPEAPEAPEPPRQP
jgi:hypothetical protein